MHRVLLLTCLVYLAQACAAAPTVDLPRVGTIGLAAEDLDEDKVTVTIDGQGDFFLDGEALAPSALAESLTPHADRPRDESLDQKPSKVFLVLRCDRAAHWASVQIALRAAFDPMNRMNRVLFAVRSLDPADPKPGTLAWFLPLHGGGPWDPAAFPFEDETEFYIGGGVTVQEALTAFDRLLRAGRKPRLYGMPAEARGEKSHVWMDGKWMPLDEVAAPATSPARADGLTGITETYEVGEMVLLRKWWFESDDETDFSEEDGPFEDPVTIEDLGD